MSIDFDRAVGRQNLQRRLISVVFPEPSVHDADHLSRLTDRHTFFNTG